MKKIIEKLEKLTDPHRQWGNLRHKLVDIVFIGLVSVICGGTDFEHMEDTGEAKYNWLKNFLEHTSGTFRRIFERLEPKELTGALRETADAPGKMAAIDGKPGNGNTA